MADIFDEAIDTLHLLNNEAKIILKKLFVKSGVEIVKMDNKNFMKENNIYIEFDEILKEIANPRTINLTAKMRELVRHIPILVNIQNGMFNNSCVRIHAFDPDLNDMQALRRNKDIKGMQVLKQAQEENKLVPKIDKVYSVQDSNESRCICGRCNDNGRNISACDNNHLTIRYLYEKVKMLEQKINELQNKNRPF